jgi:hypothetical protein
MAEKKSAGDWVVRAIICACVLVTGSAIIGLTTTPWNSERSAIQHGSAKAASRKTIPAFTATVPTTTVPAPITGAALTASTTTTTTVACPTGAPQGVDAASVTLDTTYPGMWDVSVTGSVTNESSAPVELGSLYAQLTGTGVGFPVELTPSNGMSALSVAPGQSIAVSGGPDGPIDSTTQPSVGPLMLTWTYPTGSSYLTCPTDAP